MSKGIHLKPEEIRAAFDPADLQSQFPRVMHVNDVARLLGLKRATIYEWIAKGRFNDTVHKRGKHLLFWRDRVIKEIFNGPNWKEE